MVTSSMPKFSCDYKSSLKSTLEAMGIKDAFSDVKADFSKMGKTASGSLFIGDVIHKTHIDVDEEGTRAAAATAVMMNDKGVMMGDTEVVLNRPFVYAIVDTQNNVPLFIGTLAELEG